MAGREKLNAAVPRVLIRTAKVAAVILGCMVGGIVLLTLPECAPFRVMIVNASGVALEDVGLFVREEQVWAGRLGLYDGRQINLAAGSSRYIELRGQYANADKRFLAQSAYPMPHDNVVHGFIVTRNDVVIAPWYDPPEPKWDDPSGWKKWLYDNEQVFDAVFGELACLDLTLWRVVTGSK